MKKSELKPGMKVVTKGGYVYTVVDNEHMARESGNYMYLARYDENLRYANEGIPDFDGLSIDFILLYDVVKVRWVEILPDYKKQPEVVKESMNFNLTGNSEIWLEGNKTTVLFSPSQNPEETFSGVSTCMPGDTYNKKKGIRIATYHALAKYVQNELDKMSK